VTAGEAASGGRPRGALWLIGLPLVGVVYLLFHVIPRAKRIHLRFLPRARRVRRLLSDIETRSGWPRLLAMEELGALRERAAIPALVAMLDTAESQGAVDALVNIGGASTETLLALVRVGKDGSAEHAAWTALARLNAEVPPELLVPALLSPHPQVEEAARAILLTSRLPAVADALVLRLSVTEWAVRERAVQLLGQVGQPAVARELIPLLEDPYPHVRSAVIGALEKLRPPDLELLLQDRVRDDTEDWGIRVAGAMALGRVSGLSSLRSLSGHSAEVSNVVDEAATYLKSEGVA